MPTLESANPEDVAFESFVIIGDETPKTRSSFEKGSRVTCGRPIARNLSELYAAREEKLPADILLDLETHEFWLVRLVCTLHEDRRARLTQMDFKVNFGYESPLDDGLLLNKEINKSLPPDLTEEDEPIAYDLYPLEINDEREHTRTQAINAKFSFGPFEADLGKDEVTTSYKEFKPRITAFGKQESEIYWTFQKGNTSTLASGVKEMDTIVRKRRNTPVSGRIKIEGHTSRWWVLKDTNAKDGYKFYF